MGFGGLVFAASMAAVTGLFALFAVFVFWSANNPSHASEALPYFAVPGALFGLSTALAYVAWHHQHR